MFTNLKDLNLIELEDLRKSIDKEIVSRTKGMEDELIENFIKAANALASKAPRVSLDIELMCGECFSFEKVDILRAFG